MENFFEQARKSFLMNLVPRRLRLLGARAWLELGVLRTPSSSQARALGPPLGVQAGSGSARSALFAPDGKRGPWIPQRWGLGYIFKKEG